MDTKMKRKISPMISEESIMLAEKARRELRMMGTTTVICPRCGTSPQISNTPRGERTIISCKCRYIFDGEINF